MKQIPISLDPKGRQGDDSSSGKEQPPRKHPVMGYFAVGFGVLGIFTHGYVFTPLGFLCSLIALFLGQVSWAFLGLLLAVVGIVTSPVLLAMLGLGFLAKYVAVPWH
jgi:hypothetical protein